MFIAQQQPHIIVIIFTGHFSVIIIINATQRTLVALTLQCQKKQQE